MTGSLQYIMELFAGISSIPRCSGNEQAISKWLVDWAAGHGFTGEKDRRGNVLVKVPGTDKDGPAVVLQTHMDMVCEKAVSSRHDFLKDPVELVYDGDWLRANGTSLGADNGIGMAMALAVALEDGLRRPPLELLFTVDEECGFTGVRSLSTSWLEGKYLLNLDSETEGVLTIGSAGGKSIDIILELERACLSAGDEMFELSISGLRGGHSGVDIAKHRASAVKLMVRILNRFQSECRLRLVTMEGGSAYNAIARKAKVIAACKKEMIQLFAGMVQGMERDLAVEYAVADPDISIGFKKVAKDEDLALDHESSARVIALLAALPHGVLELCAEPAGAPETSCNFAKVTLSEGMMSVGCSLRSMFTSALADLADGISSLAGMAGGKVITGKGYPAWKPDYDSALLARCRSVYKKLYGGEPGLEVTHGGLECGVLAEYYPGLEMISFGPTIKDPHSPAERVELESIRRTWKFLKALLEDLNRSGD